MDINSSREQLPAADCINNINLLSEFLANVRNIELNGSGWRYLRITCTDSQLSQKFDKGGANYVTLARSYSSIRKSKITEDNHCAL